MTDKMFTTEAASKALKWILGKDSTAVATWFTIGLGWVFYEYVYKPERAEERKARIEVAAENAKAIAEVRTMAAAEGKQCDADKERYAKLAESLMRMKNVAMSSADSATSQSEFDCDP